MTDTTRPSAYMRCQALFDQAYPGFRNAGERYEDRIAGLVTPTTTVLDLGCGGMSLAAEPLRAAGRIIGIDLDMAGLRTNDVVMHRALAGGEAIPLSAASCDLVVSQWVVEHLEHPQLVFDELARVLRPGGRAVLFTTNAWNYVPILGRLTSAGLRDWLVARLLRRPEGETFPTFYRANSRRQITHLARHAGLQLEACEFVGNPFYLAFSPALFRLALAFERLTDVPPLRGLKLYMLVTLRKS